MKTCFKCLKEKPLTDFYVCRSAKDGRVGKCAPCSRLAYSAYKEKNPDKIKASQDKYYAKNSDKAKARAKAWDADNKDRVRSNRISYVARNKDRVAEYHKNYAVKNRAKLNAYAVEYKKRKMAEDPDFELQIRARQALHKALRRTVGADKVMPEVGYSAAQLKLHIKSNMLDGMSWDNHGDWHIDHKIEIAQHIIDGERDLSVINALSNLQPLWAEDNVKKNAEWRASKC